MIKILDHTKSLTELVSDTTNGLGKFQPLDAFVTEELNGIYEAEIVMLQTDKHFNDLALNGLLKINAGEVIGEQIFRIYFISKPIDGKILIKAQHISYDLNKIPVRPFTATGAINVKNQLLAHIVGTYPFDMMTDIQNTNSTFTLDIPRNFRECLGGWEGSILDVFRCEYEWDNLLVRMLARRGTDEGVRIAYGKNLTDFKQEENMENVYTSVLGYAVVNEQTYVGNVYHKIVSNMPRVKIVDFSNEFNDIAPTIEQLDQKAQEYATRNAIEVPNVSIDIKFVPLYQTEEYKNIAPLERVALGDTVHVYFEKMNIEATSRVVKTVWNVNLNKYESVELGDTKANLTTLLDDAVQEAKQNITIDAGFIESEMNEMSQLIINGLGLHRTLVPLSTGGYRMYLHNKPTLAESDTQYVITAEGFMISQDYGQTWNSGWDSSGNAVMNSLSTITLKALEIYGSYIQGSTIVFGDPDDPDGKYITAAPYADTSGTLQGVSFDGTGYIRMRPQEQFDVSNLAADGTNVYNRLIMRKDNNGYSNIIFYNYDEKNNFALANRFRMETGYSSSCENSKGSLIELANRITYEKAKYANYFRMIADKCYTEIYLENREGVSSRNGGDANDIFMIADIEDGNMLQLRNYHSFTVSEGTVGVTSNVIVLYHKYTDNINTLSIDNYEVNPSDTYFVYKANSIKLNSTSTMIQTQITNYDLGSQERLLGNQIDMRSTDTLHSFDIINYDVDSDRSANYILMSKTSNENNITIGVDRGGSKIGRLNLWRMTDTNIKISLGIPQQTVGSKVYPRCEIIFSSSDGSIQMYGSHLYWNGSQKW